MRGFHARALLLLFIQNHRVEMYGEDENSALYTAGRTSALCIFADVDEDVFYRIAVISGCVQTVFVSF